MEVDELRSRIASGEDSRLELKSVVREKDLLPDKREIAKTLCCFANAGGGYLVLGVEDDGTVTGIGDRAHADRLQRHVSQIAETLSPSLLAEQRLFDLEGHRVLVVSVPAFLADRPFYASRICFIRDGNRCREATRSEVERLVLSASRLSFDEQVIESSTVEADLDLERVHALFRAAYPTYNPANASAHLRAAHCVEDGKLTVAGALLFSREPTRLVPGAYVTAMRFPGDVPGTQLVANERIEGALTSQFDAALAFLHAHVPRPSDRKAAQRKYTGVPDEVWIEAVTNALSHRDYRSRSQTRILAFDGHVEIINPGELLNRLTVEGVKLGTSQLRNPSLANLLARARQRDNAGLGVPEIIARTLEAGLPEPEIIVANGEFRLLVHTRPRDP